MCFPFCEWKHVLSLSGLLLHYHLFLHPWYILHSIFSLQFPSFFSIGRTWQCLTSLGTLSANPWEAFSASSVWPYLRRERLSSCAKVQGNGKSSANQLSADLSLDFPKAQGAPGRYCEAEFAPSRGCGLVDRHSSDAARVSPLWYPAIPWWWDLCHSWCSSELLCSLWISLFQSSWIYTLAWRKPVLMEKVRKVEDSGNLMPELDPCISAKSLNTAFSVQNMILWLIIQKYLRFFIF